jgi:hypothetical protein
MLSDDESDICKFSISFEKYFFDRLWRSFFCERSALLFDRSLVWRWEYNVAGFYSIDDELFDLFHELPAQRGGWLGLDIFH